MSDNEDKYQVNFPVPRPLGMDWKAQCQEYGMEQKEDLAGLLYLSTLFPKAAHLMFRDIALDRIPIYIDKDAVQDRLELIRQSIADVFREDPKPEPHPSDPIGSTGSHKSR